MKSNPSPPCAKLKITSKSPPKWNLKFGFFRDPEKASRKFPEIFEKCDVLGPYFHKN